MGKSHCRHWESPLGLLIGWLLFTAPTDAQNQPRLPAAAAPPTTYSAEADIGLVAGDASDAVAAANTLRLNAALAATHAAGTFDFARGGRGPVLFPIVFAAKPFYFKGELQTAVKVGSGVLVGGGGQGYPLGEADFGARGIGGATTRFVRIDPTPGSAILRLRGSGFSLRNIELYGRRLNGNIHSGAGTRATYGIALEGRNYPAAGKHHIDDVAIVDCEQAIAFLPGYGDNAGQLTPSQTHADETLWGRITVFNCGRAIVSTNEQACWHHFQHLQVASGNEPTEVILDAERGGQWKVDMLTLGVPNTTLLRVKDFSHNMARFDIDGLYRDHFASLDVAVTAASNTTPIVVTSPKHEFRPGMQVRITGVQGNTAANGLWTVTVPPNSPDAFALDNSVSNGAYSGGGSVSPSERITLFEFAGKNPQPWMHWSVRIKGIFSEMTNADIGFAAAGEPTYKGGFRYSTSDLVKLNGLTLDPSGRNGTSILLDINNLPPWVAAKYWPHGAYRLTAAERDLIETPYAGLTVFVLDAPSGRRGGPAATGHYEMWDGAKWARSGGPQ